MSVDNTDSRFCFGEIVHFCCCVFNIRYFGMFVSVFFFSPYPARMMESMAHEVELRNAEPDIIELLIEFIYTARYNKIISQQTTAFMIQDSFFLCLFHVECVFFCLCVFPRQIR